MLRPAAALAALSVLLVHCGASAAEAPGDRTVRLVCSACHGTGLLGAPRIGNAGDWSGRLRAAGSVDALLSTAAHGKNNMPPRGGVAELSDAELRAAIESMLAQSGVR